MSRKDLQHISLKKTEDGRLKPEDQAVTPSAVEGRSLSEAEGQPETFQTAEEIPIKKQYTAEDIENLQHLNFAAGIAPHLRGPYSTMYVRRPWTIRQYA